MRITRVVGGLSDRSARTRVRAWLLVAALGTLAVVAAHTSHPIAAADTDAGRQVEWLFYGGDQAGTRFSPLEDITPANVGRLEPVWQWKHWETDLPEYGTRTGLFEVTPLMVNGVLYVTTPYNSLAALDAESGKELWRFDAEAYKVGQVITGNGWKHRGTAIWRDGDRLRLFLNAGRRLFSIDAATGKPVATFGDAGSVRLSTSTDLVGPDQSSPPTIFKDLVIVGSMIGDRIERANDPVGQVQAFDAKTGKRMWAFSVIPQSASDPAARTWERESWKVTGHGNVWAPMTLDASRGLLYLPTSTPSSDFYGGRRIGANLYAESLVCLDAATGKMKWHFQTVHHGLWDYDNPAPPNLVTITVDGRRVEAVAQVSKQGFTYVFDRVSGKPVWPIVERPVPTDTDVPGEQPYPTQPIPSKPPAFVPQGITLGDANPLTPEITRLATEQLGKFRLGPLFTPPSLRGTVQRPGFTGGGNWSGAAFDPRSGYLFVRASHAIGVNRVGKNNGTNPLVDVEYSDRFAGEGASATLPGGMPLIGPPYSILVAIDLNKGAIAWRSPLGEGTQGLRNHPLLKGVALPDRLGSPSSTGAIATRSGLVFIASNDGYLYAFESATGRELSRVKLPFTTNAGVPMTYRTRSGRQFIVLPSGTGAGHALVAFALPANP